MTISMMVVVLWHTFSDPTLETVAPPSFARSVTNRLAGPTMPHSIKHKQIKSTASDRWMLEAELVVLDLLVLMRN